MSKEFSDIAVLWIVNYGFDATMGVVLVRGVAQPGSAIALGAMGRRFESCHPDW